MSRFGLEDDEPDFDELPTNAVCQDCGGEYSRAEGDPTVWCDPCSDRRDGWVTAIEERMQRAAVPEIFARLPTLSAVQQSRAGKPIPKKAVSKRRVA